MFIVMQNYFHCAQFMLTVSTPRITFGEIFDTEIYIYIYNYVQYSISFDALYTPLINVNVKNAVPLA